MNWKVTLLLLALQSSAFQISLGVSSNASNITFTWQPEDTCNTISIIAIFDIGNYLAICAMSTGHCSHQISGDTLVNQLKGGKTSKCTIDTKCQSNLTLITLAQNNYTLSLTNGNDLPVLIDSAGSASVLPNIGIAGTVTSTGTVVPSITSSLSPSAKATISQSSGSRPEETDQPSESSRKTPIGAIAGGVVGGISLLIAVGVVTYAFLHRRKRSVELETDPVNLLEGNSPNQSVYEGFELAEGHGRLAGVIQEKEEARRQQNLLQADIQSQHAVQPHLTENVSTEREAQLLQQVQALSERIADLESQQRELEDRLADEDAPPDYVTSS